MCYAMLCQAHAAKQDAQRAESRDAVQDGAQCRTLISQASQQG